MGVADELGIIVCSSAHSFGNLVFGELERLCNGTGVVPRLVSTETIVFANSEIKAVIDESVRHFDHVFIIQDCENHYPRRLDRRSAVLPCAAEDRSLLDLRLSELGRARVVVPSTADNVAELKAMVAAAHVSDVREITVVLPSFPYARQDKKKGREGITASRFAEEIECFEKVVRVLTLDIHNTAIGGFFRRAVHGDMHASQYIINHLYSALPADVLDNLVVSQADAGGAAKSRHYAEVMHRERVPAEKIRNYEIPGAVEKVVVYGSVSGKYVLVPEDIIATAGTIEEAVNAFVDKGVLGVYAACSLGLFNAPAVERINALYYKGKGPLKEVITTNTVYHPPRFYEENPWCSVVHMERPFAEWFLGLHRKESVSRLLK